MNVELMNRITEIYNSLNDKISKELFETRVLYSITRDEKYSGQLGTKAALSDDVEKIKSIYRDGITAMVRGSQEKVINYIEKLQEHTKVVLCGAGVYAKRLLGYLDRVDHLVFCDKKAEAGRYFFEGIEVIPYNELLKEEYQNSIIFIVSTKYYTDIKKILIDLGIDHTRIGFIDMRTRDEYLKLLQFDMDYCRCDNLIYNTYFEENFMIPGEDEIFVDAGFYDGYTSRRFVEWCKGRYKKIIAFEPNKINYERYFMQDNDIDKLCLYNAGVWDKEETLSFKLGGEASAIDELGEEMIEVRKIDDIVGEEGCTFIKMDIEGSELKALEGAKETIKKFHPRLAISIYHKPEDIFEIPLYIKELYAGYSFYIRHYTFGRWDTVLYAVAE